MFKKWWNQKQYKCNNQHGLKESDGIKKQESNTELCMKRAISCYPGQNKYGNKWTDLCKLPPTVPLFLWKRSAPKIDNSLVQRQRDCLFVSWLGLFVQPTVPIRILSITQSSATYLTHHIKIICSSYVCFVWLIHCCYIQLQAYASFNHCQNYVKWRVIRSLMRLSSLFDRPGYRFGLWNFFK